MQKLACNAEIPVSTKVAGRYYRPDTVYFIYLNFNSGTIAQSLNIHCIPKIPIHFTACCLLYNILSIKLLSLLLSPSLA